MKRIYLYEVVDGVKLEKVLFVGKGREIRNLYKNLEAASEVYGFDYVIDNDPDEYMLLPDVLTDYDLGEYYALEVMCFDFGGNSTLERYFDFEAYGRDIRLDGDGDFTTYGWLERR